MLSLTVSIRKRSFYMVRKSKPLSNCRAILLKSVHQSRYFFHKKYIHCTTHLECQKLRTQKSIIDSVVLYGHALSECAYKYIHEFSCRRKI